MPKQVRHDKVRWLSLSKCRNHQHHKSKSLAVKVRQGFFVICNCHYRRDTAICLFSVFCRRTRFLLCYARVRFGNLRIALRHKVLVIGQCAERGQVRHKFLSQALRLAYRVFVSQKLAEFMHNLCCILHIHFARLREQTRRTSVRMFIELVLCRPQARTQVVHAVQCFHRVSEFRLAEIFKH